MKRRPVRFALVACLLELLSGVLLFGRHDWSLVVIEQLALTIELVHGSSSRWEMYDVVLLATPVLKFALVIAVALYPRLWRVLVSSSSLLTVVFCFYALVHTGVFRDFTFVSIDVLVAIPPLGMSAITIALSVRNRVERTEASPHQLTCEHCNYSLVGLRHDKCPECGRSLAGASGNKKLS